METRRTRPGTTLRLAAAIACLLLVPSLASAQAIGGTVTDTTGGILPGVTVEVRSPALIEGVRTAVTDGSGQYRVIALEIGAYEVTFTLPGFSTLVRDGIDLTTGFTANIDVELAVVSSDLPIGWRSLPGTGNTSRCCRAGVSRRAS